MTYVIKEACIDVKDQKCTKECPVDCIYLAARSAYIHPDECIDCGACVPVCPVSAIVYQDELQPDEQYFLERQTQVFRDIGLPGGAKRLGRLIADHPDIAAKPIK